SNKVDEEGEDEEIEDEEEIEEEEEIETEDEEDDDEESEESAEDKSENEQHGAAKKRQEEEYRLQYETRRKEEYERVEQELRNLREKQERRRREREQEEKELAEKIRLAEEKHRQEEISFIFKKKILSFDINSPTEESKARIEAQKRKREEERGKKQAMLAGSLAGIVSSGNNCNPNFVIQKREKTERNKNDKEREEKEEAKRAYMAKVNQKPDISHLLINDLKIKIYELHSHICKLEALKYDLEKRHERQLYDLKELHEREKQVARHRALQRGLDPNEAAASPHPPKINVASKFDRQFDRRSYGDRRIIFEKVTFPYSLKYVS
ncbi:unnamed protein product, partial [Acanthocheilonema viteae]